MAAGLRTAAGHDVPAHQADPTRVAASAVGYQGSHIGYGSCSSRNADADRREEYCRKAVNPVNHDPYSTAERATPPGSAPDALQQIAVVGLSSTGR
jgi:hypothetical protein